MKTKTIVAKLAAALCLTLGMPVALADGLNPSELRSPGTPRFSTPSGMTCEDAVLVRYHAGPRWAEVDTAIAAHIELMRTQMRAGRVLFSGPFDESGGVLVVRGPDLAAAAALVERDPLVARRIVTYSAERFWMCRAASEASARR
ncbi:MAG: hypothetical protein HYY06_28550 [Deltaproteobacteria bacterium]|nr:hypothetical protein [Deltaproteobacteria bacterium]